MSPISIDPALTLSSRSKIVHLHSPRDTEHLKTGDVVESWDYLFGWDEDCMDASALEEWRKIPDPIVDDYLSTLPSSILNPSHDQLSLLLSLSSTTSDTSMDSRLSSAFESEETRIAARKLVAHLTEQPPLGVRATDKQIEEAQECFYRFAGGLLLGTFYVSLVGGFSSPRITNVLHQTSYLVAPTLKSSNPEQSSSSAEEVNRIAYAPITPTVRKRTSIRLLETLQFVLDIMGSPLPLTSTTSSAEKGETWDDKNRWRVGKQALQPIHGEGWKSAVRVRLLHGVVRRRVMKTVENGSKGRYDFMADGYPLNAEDMTATLASFSVAPLWALTRIHSPCPAHLRRAYIAHWRHVGYYLGIPTSILQRHFNVETEKGEGPAGKIFASLLTHLFIHPSDLEVKGKLPPPTLPLLHTAAGMPPFKTPLKHHFRAARFFLGDALSDALNIPETTTVQRILLQFYLLGVVYPEYFGMIYPRRGWERTRMELTQDLLGRLVRFSLEGRRSMFRPHVLEDKEGMTAKQEADLPDVVAAEEKVGVGLDPVGGRKVVARWRWMLLEMVVVTGVAGLGTAWSIYRVGKIALG